MLNLRKLFNEISEFISEAAGRIFSPSDDAYPPIGVQPFSGEPSSKETSPEW